MLQLILEPILLLLLLVVGYVVGYLPVVIASGGSIEPGSIAQAGDRSFCRAKGMKWWHVTYRDNGTRYLPAEAVALIGWFLLGCMYGFIWLLLVL